MPLWKRQETQKVSWRRNARGEFEEERSGCSVHLPALRGARSFTVGSGSDEESLPPVAYRIAISGRHASPEGVSAWPQRVPVLLEHPNRPKPHLGG